MAATVRLSPVFNDEQLDNNGLPANGYLLQTDQAGSSTPAPTYTDSSGTATHADPIVLNSRGEPPFPIWLVAGVAYKFTLKTPAGAVVRVIDNVTGVNDATISQSQWQPGPAATYVSANSFTVSGDQRSLFQVRRRLQANDAGGTKTGTIVSSAYDGSALTTVTVLLDSGIFANPIQSVFYSLLSADDDALPPINPAAPPPGRLTLTSGAPIPTTDVTAATTVYYTPYIGDRIPVPTAGGWVLVPFAELSQLATDTTKSPGAVVNNSNYDMFVWLDGTTLRCTRGPTWNAGAVAGSDNARGTGAGSTDLVRLNGRLVNANAISNGPAAQRGLYVGTVRSNGTATFDDSSVGAVGRKVWNFYNRVRRSMSAAFTTNRTTGSTSYVELNTEIRTTFLVGVNDEEQQHVTVGTMNMATGIDVYTSIGVNSATPEDVHSRTGFGGGASGATPCVATVFKGVLGSNYATVLGKVSSGTGSWIGAAAAPDRTTLKTYING